MKRFVIAIMLGVAFSASATIVKWEFPRLGCCHEGLAFADGRTGVLVWGGGDTINFTIGRGDLWDHRGGYPWTKAQSYTNITALAIAKNNDSLLALFKKDTPKGEPRNPYMMPLGRVVVKAKGEEIIAGELCTDTGIGRLIFKSGKVAWLAMSKPSHAFSVEFEKGMELSIEAVPAMKQEVSRQQLTRYSCKDAEEWKENDGSAGGFVFTPPADPAVSLSWYRKGNEISITTDRGDKKSKCDVSAKKLREESKSYWAVFWHEGARVHLPDPVLQEVFDYGMYKFGAMTDPDGIAVGLQGQWLEDDKLVPWEGDYHFNINAQECYSPAYRGGHFKNLLPLFKMVLSWRELLRDNARKFAGVEGYVLPHSVDDRGVCIGGFWTGTIDHASTAWIADMMFRYVKYSGDVEFLKAGAFDFMKGAMVVYRAMMENYQGRLSMPIGPSPEWGEGDITKKLIGRDPSFQLAAAHALARDLIAAAKLLGEEVDPMWVEVKDKLPTCNTTDDDGIILFEGQTLEHSHRHHSHLAGIYPFDIIDPQANGMSEILRKTYDTWVYQGTGAWSGWCVPWASILHTAFGAPEAAVQMIHNWKTFYNNPGHGSTHDAWRQGFTYITWRPTIMQMDGQCAAVTAIMEMLAHETMGEVEFFKGCPDSWKDVSFENLALSDGRRVSGRRLNGKVTIVEVK